MCQSPKKELEYNEYLKTVEENRQKRMTFKQKLLEVENRILHVFMNI